MTKPNLREEWLCAQRLLKESEQKAGIERELSELHQRHAYIDYYDQHASDYRKIVFGISNHDLRRDVIHYSRECHRLCKVVAMEELRELQNLLNNGHESLRQSALIRASISCVAAVILGEQLMSYAGALIGATISLLVGFDSVRRADRTAIANTEQTKREIQDQLAFIDELGQDGDFSLTEETAGVPDYETT